MLKNNIVASAVLSLLILCSLSAQTEDPEDGFTVAGVHVKTFVEDFDYETMTTSGTADNVYFKDDKYAEDKLPKNAEAIR